MNKLLPLSIIVFFATGCTSINYAKTEEVNKTASILILPAHDVVQGGKPHPVGVGSGEQLQSQLVRDLAKAGFSNVSEEKVTSDFNHTTTITHDKAIEIARKANADYCLLLNLGEFRNAAPMTFRSDFVTLNSGFLIDVKKGKDAWVLTRPYMIEKTNIGDHYGLINSISEEVVKSISGVAQ